MRRATFFLSAAALVLGASAAFAQPANLSGHWVQEVLAGTRAGPPADGGGGGAAGGGGGRGAGNPQGAGTFSGDFFLIQDAKTIKVWRTDTQTGDTLTNSFNLDGSESNNGPFFGGGANATPATSTLKWNGKTLVITTNGPVAGGAGNQMGVTTTSLWMAGKQLRIQTERPGNNGGSGTSILTIFNKMKK